MARIALRAYNREIEHLIEGGQIDEAIAHCRHIFKYFPKHINTYRLLGKAYLETQRYGDAADILQRVLSSIPDDFISHLGMSIIREDEGNLDEAIWHMERAFEVQPANRAIQDELRRLYGRRDGLEPPKIRLTRGALARMYAKGDLYPQAIAELRAAMAEDPQRLDLQVVLADVYAKAGQRVEAASICNSLLRKLPYCLIANQVMADILADSERSEDARVYRQRAQALDAYLAHISPGAPTPDKVPDIAVSLERLDWQPGKSIEGPGQPDWAASLGVELETGTAQKEEIPDWLSAVQPDSDATTLPSENEANVPFTDIGGEWTLESEDTETGDWPEVQATGTAQPSTAEEIPDWMKAAGWSPATGEAVEEPADIDYDEEDLAIDQPEGELAEANLPDWLKEIAPENLDQATSTALDEEDWEQSSAEDAAILQDTPDWFKETEGDEAEDEESSAWLAGLAGAAAAVASDKIAGEPDEESPDWLKEMEAEEVGPEEDQVPDWLQESEAETEQPTVMEEAVQEEAAEAEAVPDWLQELEVEEAAKPAGEGDAIIEALVSEAEPADEIPDWLKETEAEEGETIIAELQAEDETEAVEELPDWLQETTVEDTEAATSEEPLDWLKEAEIEAETQPAIEVEEPVTTREELAGQEEYPPEAEVETETDKFEIEEEAIPTEELQPWMVEDEVEVPGEMMAEHPAEPAEEIPDWLIGMEAEEETGASEAEIAEAAAVSEAEIEPDLDIEAEALADVGMTVISPPESTVSIEPQEEIDVLAEEIEPEALEAPPAAGQEDSTQLAEMEAAAAFAWLESLAAKQGADEEGLLLSPDERSETPPEWVQATIETETGEVEAVPEAVIEELEEEEQIVEELEALAEAEIEQAVEETETFPDWLQEAGEVTQEAEIVEEPLPDWLQEAGETLEGEAGEPEEAAHPAEELPDWLKTMQLEEEPGETEAEQAEQLPDWLQETPEEIEAEQLAAEPEQDWLAELEEPIIEGDTKPTRLGVEIQEEEPTFPEEAPTTFEPSSQVEEEFQPADETQVYQPEETTTQPETSETEIDAEDGFAWLESLAAKQGVDEGMLLPPEERLETPPEWIQSALDKQFGEVETQETVEEAAEEIDISGGPVQIAPEEAADIQEIAEEKPELPDWLSDMEAESGTDETAEAIDAVAESAAMPEEAQEIPELPSWLADTEEQEAPAWTPPEPVVQKLDLNQASLVELERLPGIGFIMAQKIITYREQNGPFSNAIDLQQIPGFSPAMLQDIEDFIMVEAVEEEPLSLPVEPDTAPELAEARQAMFTGSLDQALDKYSELILHKQSLEEVIYDLSQILQRHGEEAAVWQTLGDAQMRANHVQDALESYMRAEQLFR